MRYKVLGNTGLLVSEICLGTMTFGGRGFWVAMGELDQAAANRLVARAAEAGVNFIDTADTYSEGLSEEMTGRALAASGRPRTDFVLATKALGVVGTGPNDRGASRGHLMDAVRASLKRLGTDHIDLYQIHGFDPITPVDETLRALEDIVRLGYVRYIGVSNWPAWTIMKALGISDARGISRFASLQAYYTIAGRDLEREIAPLLEAERVGLLVWSPLAGGLLSGKYDRDGNGPDGARRARYDFPPVDKDRAHRCIDVMRGVADAHQVSVARIALAWVLSRPFVTSVIIGAKDVAQLDDNLAAADITLTPDQLSALDEVSVLPAEYPSWMMKRQSEGRVPR